MDKPEILIVDDEQNILLLLSETLEGEGYAITTINNGKDAIAALDKNEFDLLLVDLKLKDMDGLQIMREARSRWPDTVVIMLTGDGSLESAMGAIKYGASDYLLKPANSTDLKESIRRGLEKRQELLQQRRLANQAREFARNIIGGGSAPVEAQSRSTAGANGNGAKGQTQTQTRAADDEVVRVSDVAVDVKRHEARRAGDLLDLTPTEFSLLVTLMNNPGRVLSCKYLVKQVQNYDLSEYDSRSMIRVHIKHLRHKIERDPNNPEYIINVRGLGYKFGS